MKQELGKWYQILSALLMLALGCGAWMIAENYTDWLPEPQAAEVTGVVLAEHLDTAEEAETARIPILDELQESADPLEEETVASASDTDVMTWLEWYERLEYVRSYLLDQPSNDEGCPLIDAPGTSGIRIGSYPIELFMLSMAGETSGGSIVIGDKGRGYGLCQFDYRYDLVDFINWAYERNPVLWFGLADYYGKYESGDPELINHEGIVRGFQLAEYLSRTDYALDQLEFMYRDYFESTYDQMQMAGFSLEKRHIAVSAAMLSININCGPRTELYLQELSPEMADEEMLGRLYELRNSVLKKNGKGTNKRYLVGEPQLALDLLHGDVNVLSDVSYLGGVSWGAQARSYLGDLLSEEEIQARMDQLGPGVAGYGMPGLATASNLSEWSDFMSRLRMEQVKDGDLEEASGSGEPYGTNKASDDNDDMYREAMKEIVLEDDPERQDVQNTENSNEDDSSVYTEDPKTGNASPEPSDVSEIVLED